VILSRVTEEAVAELGLTQGRRAWALVKVHALQH
jgi:molybdopterin-binding protein